MRWPGQAKAGVVRKELVSTIDILPTVLQVAKIRAPQGLPGRQLQRLLTDAQPSEWRQYIYAMTTGSFPRNCFVQQSIRDSRYKLISSPRPGTENLIAASYLDDNHRHFVVPGVLPDERKTVSPEVEAAFQRWERPPRYELYDLAEDPDEWTDLADDSEHAETKARLVNALEQFQRKSRDPFLDPDNLESFVKEQLANRDLGYRNKKDFRWSYLETFEKWRTGNP